MVPAASGTLVGPSPTANLVSVTQGKGCPPDFPAHVSRLLSAEGRHERSVMKARSTLATLLAGMLLLATFVWFAGSHNPVTPAGYVGYLTQGAVMGKTRYYGLQKGPTSSGRTWLLDVENISITPYTYTEDFTANNSVLSKDKLKISFRGHVVWGV